MTPERGGQAPVEAGTRQSRTAHAAPSAPTMVAATVIELGDRRYSVMLCADDAAVARGLVAPPEPSPRGIIQVQDR